MDTQAKNEPTRTTEPAAPPTKRTTPRTQTTPLANESKHTAPTKPDAPLTKRTTPRTQTTPLANESKHTAPTKPAAPSTKRTAPRTLEEYNALYTAKTGDTAAMPRGFTLAYLPERGWCQWRFDTEAKLFLIWGVSGDGHFWRDWARATGLALGCRAIVTICTRPIRAYIRLWHWQIDRTETHEGKHRFHCHTQDGRRVLITHKHTDPNGQDAYWITEYLTERNDTHG